MKICVVNNLYYPYQRGGAEQVIARSVESLLRAGHEVVLLTSTPKKDEQEIEIKNGLNIYRIHPKNFFFYTQAHEYSFLFRMLWHVRDMFNVHTAKWVQDVLETEKPDVVHTHNLMGLSFLIPRMIRRLGYHHVHTVHDVQLVEPSAMILKAHEHDWRFSGFPTKIYTMVMRTLLGSPDIVISPSQFLLDFYTSRKFFSHSQRVLLRNPVPLERIDVPTLHTYPEPFRFLYVGQIEAHKGIVTLVDAFLASVAQQRKLVELHIIGKGSQLHMLKEKTSAYPFVTFHGYVERHDLPELFAQMDMTVVPSECYENSPTVIFESLISGVPVLASAIEGIAELIIEGKHGMTFDACDQASLEEKLIWSVEHRDDINMMKELLPSLKIGLSEEEYVHALTKLYKK